MKVNNIFLIQTPFQLFNAIEAKNRFHKNENNILIFINKGNTKNYLQIQEILAENDWNQKIEIKFKSKVDKLLYPLFVKQKLGFLNNLKINKIYVALYRNISAHIINSFISNEIVLFDDGNNILKTINFINNKIYKNFQLFTSLFGFYKNKINFLYTCTIFTIFDLSNYKNIKNKIIKNDYTYFKKLIDTFYQDDNSYFIGSKIIDNGLTKEQFEYILKEIITYNYFLKRKVIYIPHRYEDIQYLTNLSKKYKFELRELSTIIEYSFIKHKIKPLYISTIRSTAVDSLKILFENVSIEIYKISTDALSKNKQKEFENIYKNFKLKNYNMKELL